MDLLKKTDSIVVHNPQSNMNNAVGVSDVLALIKKGILVGMGTDAMTTNMTEELRSALWIRHLSEKNPACGFMECVQMLTSNNAAIANRFWKTPYGRDQGGLSGRHHPDGLPVANPFHGGYLLRPLVFGLSQSTVDTTIAAVRAHGK